VGEAAHEGHRYRVTKSGGRSAGVEAGAADPDSRYGDYDAHEDAAAEADTAGAGGPTVG
jgi:hypothetical protein